MEGLIDRLYNGFLLRDVLGYVIPGSFAFACFLHATSLVLDDSFEDLVEIVTSGGFRFFVAIGLSYACGHILSGLFFHGYPLKRVFRYSPNELSRDNPGLTYDEAWLKHRVAYRAACDDIGDASEGQIERHAALVHFTGHFSAAIAFLAVYIVCLVIVEQEAKYLFLEIPLAVAFHGMFAHFRRLKTERYKLERAAVHRLQAEVGDASNDGKGAGDPSG